MLSKSWSYFLWGLVLSVLLGTAVRLVFSPKRMQDLVLSIAEKKQPKFFLDFDLAKLTLAPTFPPKLGVEFLNLSLRAKDSCVTSSLIKMDRLVLPVAWSLIWTQKLVFEDVFVENAKLIYSPAECSQSLIVPALDQLGSKENSFQKIESYLGRRWEREVQNTLRYLSSLDVNSFSIYNLTEESPLLQFQNIGIELNKQTQSAIVDFQLNPSQRLTGFKVSGVSNFNMKINKSGIELSGHGNVLEGRYNIDSKWQAADHSILSKWSVRDFPAPEILQFINYWKFSDLPQVSLRNQWFQCEGELYIPTKQAQNLSLMNRDCRLYGENGKIFIADNRQKLFLKNFYPQIILFEDFVMSALNPPQKEGLNNQLDAQGRFWTYSGLFNGNLELRSPKDLFLKGEINAIQIQLPLLVESPWVTAFKKVDVTGEIHEDSISFTLKNMLGINGKIRGELKASKAMSRPAMKDLVILEETRKDQAKIEWNFNSSEQLNSEKDSIPYLDTIEAFKFKGEGILSGNDWVQLNAEVKTKKMSSKGLLFEGLDARVSLLGGRGQLEASLQSLDFDGSNMNLAKKIQQNLKVTNLQQLNVKMRFESEGRWVLDPMVFSANNKDHVFLGRGFGLTLDESVLQDRAKTLKAMNITGPILDPRFEEAL